MKTAKKNTKRARDEEVTSQSDDLSEESLEESAESESDDDDVTEKKDSDEEKMETATKNLSQLPSQCQNIEYLKIANFSNFHV